MQFPHYAFQLLRICPRHAGEGQAHLVFAYTQKRARLFGGDGVDLAKQRVEEGLQGKLQLSAQLVIAAQAGADELAREHGSGV